MNILDILTLQANKETYPGGTTPPISKYYLSASEYNTLLKILQYWAQDYVEKINNLGNSSAIEIITTTSVVQPTNTNVYSALWINNVINSTYNNFLSKTTVDVAQEKITFKKGIGIGNTDQFLVDQYGNATLNSLTLKQSLTVPELIYNKVDIQAGTTWSSSGGGIIDYVNTSSNTITLKLETGEIGAIAVDDLCIGIYKADNAYLNSTVNSDDGKNNIYIAGFATCYFKVEEILDQQNKTFRYSLRPLSDTYTKQVSPMKYMHFAVFGNASNPARQSSIFSTKTYQRYLKGVNDWELTKFNIAAQFGDLNTIQSWYPGVSGYSAFLDSVYFTDNVQQVKSPKIMGGYWYSWENGQYVNTGVRATMEGVSSVYAILSNENIVLSKDSQDLSKTEVTIKVYEGKNELKYDTELTYVATYKVEASSEQITINGISAVTNGNEIYCKLNALITPITINTVIRLNITGRRFDGTGFEFTKYIQITLVENGKDGKEGSGPVALFRGTYDNTKTYYGSTKRVDIVEYQGHYYMTMQTTFMITGIPPTDISYWTQFGGEFDSVATGLLLAKTAYIDNLIVSRLSTTANRYSARLATTSSGIGIFQKESDESSLLNAYVGIGKDVGMMQLSGYRKPGIIVRDRNWKGAYSDTAVYYTDDRVSYNGGEYIFTYTWLDEETPVAGIEPSNFSYWSYIGQFNSMYQRSSSYSELTSEGIFTNGSNTSAFSMSTGIASNGSVVALLQERNSSSYGISSAIFAIDQTTEGASKSYAAYLMGSTKIFGGSFSATTNKYVGQAYTDIISSYINETKIFLFTVVSSFLQVDLASKSEIEGGNDTNLMFPLMVVIGKDAVGTIRLTSVTNGQMVDQDANNVTYIDMSKGDSVILLYNNGIYHVVAIRK